MSKNLGNYTEDTTTLNFNFNTHKADGTPITLAGTPSLCVYKNSTTQSTAGITLTVDYDSITGMHHVVIDLSADAFYAAGDYSVQIAAGTVDGISVVGYEVACFSIDNRRAHAYIVGGTAESCPSDMFGTSGVYASVQSIEAGVITSTSIDTGAFTWAKFASDFATGIASSVWNALTSGMITVGSIGKKLSDWVVGTIDTYTGNTKQTGDSYAVVNHATYGNAQIKTQTGAIATILAGITSLAKWLQAISRKDTPDSTALSEINSGGGTFNSTTDSNEAIRDTAPLGTAMRGTDNALLAVNYEAPDNATIGNIDAALTARLDVAISTRLAAVDYIDPPSTSDITTAINAMAVDGTISFDELQKLILAILAGKAEVGTGTVAYKRADGTTDAITVTHDTNGNRTVISFGTLS